MLPANVDFVRITAGAVLLSVLVLTAGPVHAQQSFQATVRSGQPGVIGSIGSFSLATCQDAGLQPTISGQPAQGTVAIETRQVRNSNANSHCLGKVMSGKVLVYRSRPGFRGADVVKVSYPLFNGRVEVMHDVTYTISVQ